MDRRYKHLNSEECGVILAEHRREASLREIGRRMAHSPRGGIDEQTLEIRAVEITSSDVGDAPMLPELLNQISPDQEIAGVTAPSHGLQANRCPLPGRACVHAREGGNGRRLRHAQVPRCYRRTRCHRRHTVTAPLKPQLMRLACRLRMPAVPNSTVIIHRAG